MGKGARSPCRVAPMLSPLVQERVQAEGSLCSDLHLFSPLLPALEVENIKFALFDSGLVLVYSFILGHEYFGSATSAYVILNGT